MKRPLHVLMIAALTGLMAGCSSDAPVEYARSFPGALDRVAPVDAQAVVIEQEMLITNTTARAMPAGTIWINEWYSRPFDGLAIGETVRLPLTSFRDEFSEAFRAGGFWATKAPDWVVSVLLESDESLTPLVVTTPRTR